MPCSPWEKLGEVGALAKLADERHRAEHRLVRRRVTATRHTQLVVVLAQSGHGLRPRAQLASVAAPQALVTVWGSPF